MLPQNIIPDICKKADEIYQQGAKTCFLDYYLPKDVFAAFEEYCQSHRLPNNLEYKYGGIVLKTTNNKNLFYSIQNEEIGNIFETPELIN